METGLPPDRKQDVPLRVSASLWQSWKEGGHQTYTPTSVFSSMQLPAGTVHELNPTRSPRATELIDVAYEDQAAEE